jgi:hypothetical protein
MAGFGPNLGSRPGRRPRGFSPLKSYFAKSDPGATNDANQGYGAGSYGVNTDTARVFVCRSAAVGAAVWEALDGKATNYKAGNWYVPANSIIATSAGGNLGTTTFGIFPGYVRERCTIEALGCYVGTLSAGATFACALYTNDPTSPALLGNTGALSTTNSQFVSGALGANQQVEQGYYLFIAAQSDATAVLQAIGRAGQLALDFGSATGANVVRANSRLVGYTLGSQTYGTWPATLTRSSFVESVSNVPLVAFQVASVP